MKWILDRVPADRITFRGTDARVIRDAIVAGAGVGFVATWEATRYPNLVRLFEPLEEWEAPLWLVTPLGQLVDVAH